MPDASVFEAQRRRLFGLAYRMLGEPAEAEDILQEAWLRWRSQGPLERPAAWLTRVVTRLCIDRLRQLKRRREAYIGPWLPEPLAEDGAADEAAELADSLSLAFLLMLERLSPPERAALLLREAFGMPSAELAEVLGRSDASTRKLLQRARERIRQPASGPAPSEAAAGRLQQAFTQAAREGDLEALIACLAEDVELWSDGGGKALAARVVIRGAADVGKMLRGLHSKAPAETHLELSRINGAPALLIMIDGRLETLVSWELRGDAVSRLLFLRNPEKLEGLNARLGSSR